jgi:hypothetical protein
MRVDQIRLRISCRVAIPATHQNTEQIDHGDGRECGRSVEAVGRRKGNTLGEATVTPATYNALETEKEFMQRVIVLAQMNNWLVYHTYDSRRSQRGFVDLVLVRGGRLMFVETKREDGRLTQDQSDWLLRLSRVPGVVATVWRPSDWSEIERVLQRVPVAAQEAAG